MRETVKMLAALSNELRLKIFLTLFEDNFCVCELMQILNIDQSRLSHQLRLLRYLGLVETKQEGRWVIYSVPEKIKRKPFLLAIKKKTKLEDGEQERLEELRKARIWQGNK